MRGPDEDEIRVVEERGSTYFETRDFSFSLEYVGGASSGWYPEEAGERPPHCYALKELDGSVIATFSAPGDSLVSPYQDAVERALTVLRKGIARL